MVSTTRHLFSFIFTTFVLFAQLSSVHCFTCQDIKNWKDAGLINQVIDDEDNTKSTIDCVEDNSKIFDNLPCGEVNINADEFTDEINESVKALVFQCPMNKETINKSNLVVFNELGILIPDITDLILLGDYYLDCDSNLSSKTQICGDYVCPPFAATVNNDQIFSIATLSTQKRPLIDLCEMRTDLLEITKVDFEENAPKTHLYAYLDPSVELNDLTKCGAPGCKLGCSDETHTNCRQDNRYCNDMDFYAAPANTDAVLSESNFKLFVSVPENYRDLGDDEKRNIVLQEFCKAKDVDFAAEIYSQSSDVIIQKIDENKKVSIVNNDNFSEWFGEGVDGFHLRCSNAQDAPICGTGDLRNCVVQIKGVEVTSSTPRVDGTGAGEDGTGAGEDGTGAGEASPQVNKIGIHSIPGISNYNSFAKFVEEWCST